LTNRAVYFLVVHGIGIKTNVHGEAMLADENLCRPPMHIQSSVG